MYVQKNKSWDSVASLPHLRACILYNYVYMFQIAVVAENFVVLKHFKGIYDRVTITV